MVASEVSAKTQEAVCRSVEEISEEMISLLQDLVRIPTINPPGASSRSETLWKEESVTLSSPRHIDRARCHR